MARGSLPLTAAAAASARHADAAFSDTFLHAFSKILFSTFLRHTRRDAHPRLPDAPMRAAGDVVRDGDELILLLCAVRIRPVPLMQTKTAPRHDRSVTFRQTRAITSQVVDVGYATRAAARFHLHLTRYAQKCRRTLWR